MEADIHNHSEYSALDGLSRLREMAARAVENGSRALALTDHGHCMGHVELQDEAERAGLQPIFGMEAYFMPDRLARPAEGDKKAQRYLRYGYQHLILLAQDDDALRHLWAASTEAYRTGHYGKPRLDWDVLEEHGSGLIATTACLGGMGAQDLLAGRYDEAFRTLDRLRSVFRDRLYLEIQANELADQRKLNELLVLAGDELGIPLVVASDAHFPSEEDAALHALWMKCQSGGGKDDYWHFSAMLSDDRIREMLGYLDPAVVEAAMRNTGVIADRCTARISGYADPPVFTPGGTAQDDARRLRELCERNWHRIKNPSQAHRDRMEREFAMVASKGLAGCYLIVEDICRWVRERGWLVGPGRGSAAGSLMSYLCDITSTDPLPAGLLFERFLTEGRVSLPDFDLDFASSKRTAIQDYAIRKYGEDHVVRVGTTMRYQAKGILNKLFSILKDRLPDTAEADARQVAGLVDDAEAGTAGLGLPWEEIIEDKAIAEYVKKYEIVFKVAAVLHNRVYAVGKHPAGLIIAPGTKLAGMIPMRISDTGNNKDLMVTQWDYRAADRHGWLKLDFLTLRTIDTIQLCLDLVEQRTGQRLDPRSWDAELEDPDVFADLSTGDTLGVFQLETSLCQGYLPRHQPRTIADLADITTYIRPGPRNSGATERYLARRAGREPVDYPHPLLAEHLQQSYGVMLYQEDVLRACRVLAGYSELEADGVRKILGKKLTDKIAAAGEEFTRRCTERGHDEAQVRSLWSAMAEFGKYAFNRAHGYSYATLSYWTGWLKTHYPVELIASVLSTLSDKDRMPAFATEARRLGISVLPPDVRFSGADFTVGPLAVRYGLSAVKGVGPAKVAKIVAGQPYGAYEDFRERSGIDTGILYDLARAGALDALTPSRKGVMRVIEAERDGSDVRCVHKDPGLKGPNGLPCGYDWDAEMRDQEEHNAGINAERARAGRKPLKLTVKEPPARCTRACRRYTPPEALDPAAWGEFPADELFRQDWEAYGTWMDERPFEQLDKIGDGLRAQARHFARMLQGAPDGTWPLAAVYAGSHAARTRNGNRMWWVTLATEVSTIDLACFTPYRDDEPDVPATLRMLRAGTLVSAEVVRNSYTVPGRGPKRGWRLADIWPMGG